MGNRENQQNFGNIYESDKPQEGLIKKKREDTVYQYQKLKRGYHFRCHGH